MNSDTDLSESSPSTSTKSHSLWTQKSSDETRKYSVIPLLRSHLESLFVLSATITASSLYTDQTIGGNLGEGTPFDVHTKTIEKDGETKVVAIKRLKSSSRQSTLLDGYAADPSILRPMIRDTVVMEIMEKSPFIPDLHDVGCWPDSNFGSAPYLLVELSTNGTLKKFLGLQAHKDTENLSTYVASRYEEHDYLTRKLLIIDVAMGLLAIHEQGIFHTDLKSDNILIFGPQDSRYRAKISDFGSSIVRNKAAPDNTSVFGRDVGGTRGYMAPELNDMSFSSEILRLSDSELRKLDIFSFAPVLVEALSSCLIRGFPFNERITVNSVQHLSFMRDHVGPEEWEKVILEILHKCLQPASSRCNNFIDILTILGEEERDLKASLQTSPSVAEISTSKYLAFFDQMDRYLATSEDDFDIEWFFKNCPIFAFELLACFRFLRSGLNELKSFPELIRKWTDAVPEDAGEHYLIIGLSHVFGCVAIDFEKCCENLLEAAIRENLPAQGIYRRMHEALFSIYSVETGEVIPNSSVSPLAIKDIAPGVFAQLERLESTYPDKYLAQLIRFYERWYFSDLVYSKVCEAIVLEPGDVSIMESCNAAEYNPIRNEHVETYIHVQTESLRGRSPATEKITNDDLYTASLVMAAAIIFGDEKLSQLTILCDVLRSLEISISFYFTWLEEEESMSPLMLACRLGSADAVRILRNAAGIEDTAMNRLKCSGGMIPLHFLFSFRDTDIDEICGLLSQDIRPEDTQCNWFCPSGQFCMLAGSPLDFSLKVGSEAATRSLWEQVYSTNKNFLETIVLMPGLEPGTEMFPTVYEMTSLDIVAVKFLSSMNPSIWEYLVSSLSEETKTSMMVSFRESHVPTTESEADMDRGAYYFHIAFLLGNMSQIPLMLLHGSRYTESLANQMRHGLKFFSDPSSPNFSAQTFGLILNMPDPHLQAIDYDTLQAIAFWHSAMEEMNGSSSGHSLGFIMPKTQPMSQILDALAAAAMLDDVSAFQRIVQKSSNYQINLVEEGAIQYLGAKFARDCPQSAQECLRMIFDMDVPASLHWSVRCLPRSFRVLGLERRYTETGRLLWDSVKNNNLDLVLLLIHQDPAILYPGFIHTSIFNVICVNDKHLSVLKGLLENLGPNRSLELLRRRSKVTGMTVLDVAIHHGSQQCLFLMAKFLTAGGFSMEDVFPATGLWGPLLDSIQDCARGERLILEVVSFLKIPMSIASRLWGSGAENVTRQGAANLRVLTMLLFVLEMSHREPTRSEAVLSLLKEYCADNYDPVLASEMSNYDENPEENPGSLAGEVRILCFMGRAVRRWKLLFAVACGLMSISMTVFFMILRRFFF